MMEKYRREQQQISGRTLYKQGLSKNNHQKKSVLVQQFKLKTKQILNDDLKIRRTHQALQPIHPSHQHQIIDFLKGFRSAKKQQFIELAFFLTQKYIELTNLKICLQNFKYGQKTRNFTQAFPFYGVLDHFTCEILTNLSQTTCYSLDDQAETVKTQESQSIKCNNQNKKHIDSFLEYSEPVTYRNQKQKKDTLNKEATDSLIQLENLVDILFTGNFELISKQRYSATFNKRYRQNIDGFMKKCESIRKIIEFLNSTVLISDKIKPQVNLSSLRQCLDKLTTTKIPNSKKLPKQKQRQVIHTTSSSKSKMDEVEQLKKDLNQVRDLFNQKSTQYVLGKRKYQTQMQENIKSYQIQIEQLKRKVAELKQELSKKDDQFEEFKKNNRKIMSESQIKMSRLKISNKILQEEKENINKQVTSLQNQKESLQEYIIRLQQQISNQLQQITSKQMESKQLSIRVQKLEQQNAKLKDKLNILEDNLKFKQSQIIQLTKQKEIEHQQLLQIVQNQQVNYEKFQTYMNISSQKLLLRIKHLNESLKIVKQKSAHLTNNQKSTLSTVLNYTKLNYHFQSSDILKPASWEKLNEIVVQDDKAITCSHNDRRDYLMKSNLHSLNQKEFLIQQVQNYTTYIQGRISQIQALKLLYRYDQQLKANFHEYIDEKPHFLVLFKLSTGAIVGGYSHLPLKKGTRTDQGFLFSLSLMESYFLKDKFCLTFDEYYLIFGNSQIRIRLGQNIFYSNFGMSNAHFSTKNTKYTDFLQTKIEREVPFEFFEVYQVVFDNQ